MSSILEASVFMAKNYSKKLHSIKNTGKDITSKQMFKSWSNNQMRFMGWIQWVGKILHGDNNLWSVMKKSSVSRTRGFTYFQILWYALERCIRTQHQILFRKNSWVGSKIHHNTELWTQSTVSRWNSSGILFQDPPHCSSATKSKSSCQKWAIQHNLKDGSSSCRCLMTSYGDLQTMNGNVFLTPH